MGSRPAWIGLLALPAGRRTAWRDWIVLGRPHTASLTIPATLLGAVVAGASDPALYLLLGIWALLFHYFGFVHNNLADLPHDRSDPGKQHFPLVSGVIAPTRAKAFWVAGTLLVEALGLLLVQSLYARTGSAGPPWANLHLLLALAALHLAILLGAAYNELSKRWRGGPFLISVSYALLPVFAYAVAGGGLGRAGLAYLFAYSFALMLHQIGFAGYLKDLAPDPVNWLRAWGARALAQGEGVYAYAFPPRVQAWAWASRLACPALAVIYVVRFVPRADWILVLPFVALWTALMGMVFWRLTRPGTMPRQRKLAGMGSSEVLAYFVQVASFHALLGPLALAFYAGPLVWFVAWNRVLWGTSLGPRV
jgi:hypothetical protein